MSVPNSLVQYDEAIPVTPSFKSGKQGKQAKVTKEVNSQAEDVLNSILPPRESTDEGQLWVQYVSSKKASVEVVQKLQEDLDALKNSKAARETGIDAVREELYAQCFDEIIRQVTIECTERGLLLLRIRDELRMTIQAYQSLYESSISLSMRKTLRADQDKAKAEETIKKLEQECTDIQNKIDSVEEEIEESKEQDQEEIAAEQKAHEAELKYRNRQNDFLRSELEQLLNLTKTK